MAHFEIKSAAEAHSIGQRYDEQSALQEADASYQWQGDRHAQYAALQAWNRRRTVVTVGGVEYIA